MPEQHLSSCHTCDGSGRRCGLEEEGGEGVAGVDFILYVSSVTTGQCLESVGGEAETVAYAAHCQQVSYQHLVKCQVMYFMFH